MRADLHVHSTYSDGKMTPMEICSLAKARGLSVLSMTDHDTLMGLEDKRAAAKANGLRYVSGWEISAYQDEGKIHMLGYGCEMGEAYDAFTKARVAASFARVEESVKKCNEIGIPLTVDEVLAMRLQDGEPAHTKHIARALQKYVSGTVGEIYEKYLSHGRVANSNIGRPSPKEAIEIIHALGGVAVLAHPGRSPFTDAGWEKLIHGLKEQGLDGIEAFYTTHTERETAFFQSLADKYGLFVTGGSDMHVEDGIRELGAPYFKLTSSKLLSLVK